LYENEKMKTLLLILLLLGLVGMSACRKASAPPAQTNSASQPGELPQPTGGATTVAEVRYFRGSIGSTLGLQMKLNREGEKLSGDYYYQKIGTKIELRGTVDKDNNLRLEEFDANGKQTGIFKGIWKNNEDGLISLAGNWSKPNSDKMVAFSLHQEPIHFTSAEITPKAVKETNKRLNYEINAQYPQVTGSTDRRFDKFNQEARNVVTRKVSMFRKEMAERAKEEEEQGPPTEPETSGSDLSIGYTVNLATDDLISVQFDIGVYYQGAAHPNSHSEVLNYDVKSEKALKLADLFKPGAKYLPAISSYSIQDLKKQSRAKGADSMLDDEWIGKGAGAEASNYQSWTISRKGLGINFDSYQVAPYAAGPQHVLIPYPVLKQLIKPEGVLAQFVQ
jgi:Protein of unknown function (DUF3298)/Deacetylase PdaC